MGGLSYLTAKVAATGPLPSSGACWYESGHSHGHSGRGHFCCGRSRRGCALWKNQKPLLLETAVALGLGAHLYRDHRGEGRPGHGRGMVWPKS